MCLLIPHYQGSRTLEHFPSVRLQPVLYATRVCFNQYAGDCDDAVIATMHIISIENILWTTVCVLIIFEVSFNSYVCRLPGIVYAVETMSNCM